MQKALKLLSETVKGGTKCRYFPGAEKQMSDPLGGMTSSEMERLTAERPVSSDMLDLPSNDL